jgi:DNA-binding NtrC family response regulator
MAHKIAHVDDDPDIRKAVRTILEAEGYEVENYSEMADFMKSIANAKTRPVLAILDVMVEKEDSGLGAFDVLSTKCPDLPVILLTSLGEMIRPYFEQEKAIVWIVEKPITPEKLLSIVHSQVKEVGAVSS